MDQFRQYKVEGSPASAEMHDLLDNYSRKDSALYVTFMQLDSLQKNKASDSVLNIVRQQRDQQIADMNAYVKNFINQSKSPANRFFAIGNFALRSMPMNESKALAEASADKFKEHSGLAKLKSLFAVQAAQQPPAHPLLNKQAPEISMPDITGNTFNLSSLRGKYVLVDFWASWCKPCREENPNVVAAYNQFKNKNFTILGVSLDNDKNAWIKAIQKDGLNWTHISDLKMWETSVVNTYQFEGIPFNVLIDPQGKVIATNLRGPALTQQLSQILK
jgi:peroxiredoxin